MRRTKDEAEATRESLLDAAESVFMERGVARATLADVAAAAGVTRGAIQHHFGTKAALFRAMHERSSLFHERFADIGTGDGPVLERLSLAGAEAVAYIAGSGRARRVCTILMFRCEFVGEMAEALERLREAGRSMRETISAVFAEAERRGELGPGWTPDAATGAWCCATTGVVTEWLRQDGAFDLVAEDRTMRAVLMRSLREPRPTA